MFRSVKATEGTGTVEFALVAILFFTLLQGIVEGGRVFNGWLVITSEAMEGAHWGATRVGDPAFADFAALETAVESYVIDRTRGVLVQDPAAFGVDSTANADTVIVRINYKVAIISPLISGVWPDFQLTAESIMRSE